MTLRTILTGAVLAAAVAAPAAALAQAPPVDGGTEVGGYSPSYLELALTQPATAFASFSKAKTYELSFEADATATDPTTLLTLADGDVASGSKLGHLTSGSKRLPLPLEARADRLPLPGESKVPAGAFQPLDQPVGVLLTRWNDAMSHQKAKVKLRQTVKSKAAGSYRKVLLVTLSTETP
jgi:hypothetical protein